MNHQKSFIEIQYEAGRKYAGTSTQNPWKKETDLFRAWDQGYRGVPMTFHPEPLSAVSQTSARPAAGRLFD